MPDFIGLQGWSLGTGAQYDPGAVAEGVELTKRCTCRVVARFGLRVRVRWPYSSVGIGTNSPCIGSARVFTRQAG